MATHGARQQCKQRTMFHAKQQAPTRDAHDASHASHNTWSGHTGVLGLQPYCAGETAAHVTNVKEKHLSRVIEDAAGCAAKAQRCIGNLYLLTRH